VTKSFYIYAYPRSGSHYLKALLTTRLGTDTVRSHDLEHYKKGQHLISVVRNPLDCITSDAAIGMYHKGFDPETGLWNVVNFMTWSYIKTLKEIYKKADTIIDFNNLVSDPEGTAIAIAKIVDVPVNQENRNIEIEEQTMQYGSPNFVISAREIPIYERVKQLMSTMGVSEEANEIYRLVMSKAIDTQI